MQKIIKIQQENLNMLINTNMLISLNIRLSLDM